MSLDHRLGLLALNRFGLGSRADGDLQAASEDPRGFLLAELADRGASLLAGPDLLETPAALKALFAEQDAKLKAIAAAQALNAVMAEPPVSPGLTGAAAPVPEMATPGSKPPAPPPPIEQRIYRAEALARLRRAAAVRAGFVERLVLFWSNHFCVSASKGPFVRITAGAFEREAIRPYVLGRFADMLAAVERHPAMVFYLDNQQSAGSDSVAGRRPGRGLNENLGREILELHTLGADGGYSQSDVTSLANIITGWTFAGRDGRIGEPGTSVFFANLHQPGSQTLLGRVYDQDGRAQGEAALRALAMHPATARHIALKLARHFVADDPSPALVSRLAEVYARTDGDLAEVAKALIAAPDSWNASRPKMRDPWQFIVAAIRFTGYVPPDANPTLGALNLLGQPLWSPPGPNGFSDASAAWVTPEGLKLRLDIADRIATLIPNGPNPIDLLKAIAGSAASDETRRTLAGAASKQQALALLLMSPEIQRR